MAHCSAEVINTLICDIAAEVAAHKTLDSFI